MERMRSTTLWVLLGPVLGACGFKVGSSSSVDGSVIDARIDAPPLVDAPIDGPGTMLCPWPYTPAHIDPCGGLPATTLGDLDLSMAGTYAFDSGTVILQPPSGALIPLTTTIVNGAKIIWVHQLRVQAGVTLRLTGTAPVVIVATNMITIDGTVDASSRGAASLVNDGAGASPTAICLPTVAGNGAPCSQGGSGGGGGGFGTFGGNGGYGGVGQNCVAGQDGNGISGGAGGPVSAVTTIRGGCNGGAGAIGNAAGPGLGGRGGGAVYLVARDQVTVSATGKVLAGGAGGRAATAGRSAGGGGGSGGMIRVAGNLVTVAGVLAANGGGGGGGCNGNPAMPGQDGHPNDTVALGGAKESAGEDGGAGAFLTTNAVGGGDAGRGGGGGGGGVGVIQLQTGFTPPVTSNATLSPPPT